MRMSVSCEGSWTIGLDDEGTDESRRIKLLSGLVFGIWLRIETSWGRVLTVWSASR